MIGPAPDSDHSLVHCKPLEDETAFVNLSMLYNSERQRVVQLEKEIDLMNRQSKAYAKDLAKIYSESKYKKKELASANKQLVKYANDLNTTLGGLKKAHFELQMAYYDTIHRLVVASEYKDHDTGGHISRMGRYCTFIAEKLGLPSRTIELILYASPMHDIGKIGIPDNILLKNDKLSSDEFDIMKTHTQIGANILANSNADVLAMAQGIALYHHERWDGSGYPHGISHDAIPVESRIVSLADTFDAIISKRPYKPAYPIEYAFKVIMQQRGKHFDPVIADIFLNNVDVFERIKREVET